MLVTHSGDGFTVDRVAEALERRRWRPLRLDCDRFPGELALTVHLGPRGAPEVVLEAPGQAVRLTDARAVWLRRLWPPTLPPELPADDRAACADASSTALVDALLLLPRARWVNPLWAEQRAESKLLQLATARALGFELPETVVTNAPEPVRRLLATHPRVVTKLLRPLVYSVEPDPRFFYTTEVRAEDLGCLERLRHAPQIFQPLVEKARELRVVVVGRRVFAAAIDTRASPTGWLDWRKARPGEAAWREALLPRALERRLLAMLKRLGLAAGAFDFIVTAGGRYVFLEVNPGGEWGWLEDELGFDISGAIAEALTTGLR